MWQGNCVYLRWTLYIQSYDALKIMLPSQFCLTDFCVVFFLFFLDFCWCWENRIKQWQKKLKYIFYAVFVPGNYKHRFPFPHKWWNSVPIKKSDSLLSRYQFSVTWPMFLWMDFLFLSCSCNDPALYKTSIVLLSPVTDQHVMFALLYIS